MLKTKRNEGFTLIELVIVLAIAALILAGVLIAVSGAQQNRRDTQRKSDASTYSAALENWASNHNGAYPASHTVLPSAYFNRRDPSTDAAYTESATPGAGQFTYVLGQDCAGTTGGRFYAVTFGLEAGTFCASNHQ